MVKCNQSILTAKDGRTVRLSGGITECEIKENDRKEIVSLTCRFQDCDFTISIGDTVRPKPKSPYKVNMIIPGMKDGKVVCYDLMVAKSTLASVFALPFLGGTRHLFMWDSLFVNAFIATEEEPNCIALLYRFSGDPLFLKFEAALGAFRTFVRKFDPDPHHVVFVFDIPKNGKASFKHFKNGRYSQMDDIWKLKILEFHGFDIDGRTGKILFQSESLRKEMEEELNIDLLPGAELHSIPNMKLETFNPEHYKVKMSIL
jgi:hypothetical protein